MTILLPQIFFQAQRDEEGKLFGCFCGEEVISDPIYSKEMAYMVFRELKKTFNLSPEEITAVEVCIESTDLQISVKGDELITMRVNSVEADLMNVFNIMGTPVEDREIEKNCVSLKTEEGSRLN